jgi:hypothetical protein
MKDKDIKQIKFDLGLCADVLMSIFLSMFISKLLGIIYFCASLVIEIINYIIKK